MKKFITLTMAAAALALAGCADQAAGPKPDQKSSETANNNYVSQDMQWTSGDKASWEKTIKLRSQGQNDYVRSKSL